MTDAPGRVTDAPAKLNAALLVGAPRPDDGRHELVTVMQALDLADRVSLRPRPAGDGGPSDGAAAAVAPPGDLVVCPGVEGDNLALDALRAFRSATGWDAPPVLVEIEKRIPVAAGMAGGSTDAAATLRLAAAEAGVDDEPLLLRLAAGLGADVAHGLRPGLAVATGAGERVRRVAGRLAGSVVVVRSPHGLSTAAVYRRADELGGLREPDELADLEARIVAALDGGEPDLPDELRTNDLEPAARTLLPAIDDALLALAAAGGRHPMVCGSGPTTVAWFPDAAAADDAAAALRGEGHDALAVAPLAEA